MQTIINWLRGSQRLEVSGPFPERFLNICAANGVGFWGVEWVDGHTLRLWMTRRDARRARELAERSFCALEPVERSGVPFFLARFRRRYALLAGLACSLLAVCVLSQFVLVIEVSGNETISEQVILEELKELGLGVGTYGPAVNSRQLSQELLLRLDGLSFFSVNLHGVRAEVIVREERPAPEVVDTSVPADVVAGVDGLLTHVWPENGAALAAAGDTVAAGDVLISGTVTHTRAGEPEEIVSSRETRAMGQVWARTWRTLSASAPLTAEGKSYTGRTAARFSLRLGTLRWNFYRNAGISYEEYDKITTSSPLVLPGGLELPAALVREEYAEYEPVTLELDGEAEQARLKEALTAELEELIGPGGEVLSASFSSELTDGVLTVTLRAECEEQIGRTVERGSPDK